MRQEFFKLHHLVRAHQHLVLSISLIQLMHELPATPTRRDDASILADSDDALDTMFPSRDHRGDGAVLSAEADTAGNVNADTQVDLTVSGPKSTTDVARGLTT